MTEPRQRFRRSRARRERQSRTDNLSGLVWVVVIGLGTVLVFALAYAVPALL